MFSFSSLLFLQLEDVKNPDAKESHQDFCKHNRWTVLELFYGMDYMLFLGFRRLFLLRSSVIVLFSNFLLLFCVYMLSIFLFLILYSVRMFLLLMCGKVL